MLFGFGRKNHAMNLHVFLDVNVGINRVCFSEGGWERTNVSKSVVSPFRVSFSAWGRGDRPRTCHVRERKKTVSFPSRV